MNITTALPNYPIAPAPLADNTRRDNRERELVKPLSATADSPAERPLTPNGERRTVGRAKSDERGENATDGTTGKAAPTSGEAKDAKEAKEAKEAESAEPGQPKAPNGKPLSEEDLLEVRELQQRDAEVKTHEQQHAAVGGQYAGAPSYTYERGPDGKRYAVGGAVSIDVAPVKGDPEATIRKMEVVRRAALAPAQPSSADRAIAADAAQKAAQARAELAQQTLAETRPETNSAARAEAADNDAATSDDADTGAAPKVGAEPIQAAPPASGRRTLEVDARAERVANFYNNATSTPTSQFSALA